MAEPEEQHMTVFVRVTLGEGEDAAPASVPVAALPRWEAKGYVAVDPDEVAAARKVDGIPDPELSPEDPPEPKGLDPEVQARVDAGESFIDADGVEQSIEKPKDRRTGTATGTADGTPNGDGVAADGS